MVPKSWVVKLAASMLASKPTSHVRSTIETLPNEMLQQIARDCNLQPADTVAFALACKQFACNTLTNDQIVMKDQEGDKYEGVMWHLRQFFRPIRSFKLCNHCLGYRKYDANNKGEWEKMVALPRSIGNRDSDKQKTMWYCPSCLGGCGLPGPERQCIKLRRAGRSMGRAS